MKIHSALDAGGGGVVRMATVPSLDRFQAQAIWEMSVKARRGYFSPFKMHGRQMMHFNTIFARHTRLIAIAVYVAEAGLALAAPENTPEINWSDALAGWQRLETNTNSLSCDLSETFISPAKAQSTSELAKWSLNYKRDWYRIQKTALQDGKVHHEKAWVRNSAYSFVVAKSSKASPWVLYDVTFELEKPTEADIGDKNFGMKVRMPWCVFDVPLRTLVDEPSFTIKSSSKSIRGSDQLVEFQFEVSNPDSPSSNLRRLRNGRVVLVPAMNWAICDYDAALSSLDGQNSITTHAVAHIDYVNENSGTARVRRMSL